MSLCRSIYNHSTDQWPFAVEITCREAEGAGNGGAWAAANNGGHPVIERREHQRLLAVARVSGHGHLVGTQGGKMEISHSCCFRCSSPLTGAREQEVEAAGGDVGASHDQSHGGVWEGSLPFRSDVAHIRTRVYYSNVAWQE